MTSVGTSRLLAILEDDQSVQDALQDLIQAEGMSALCFSSAEQFLRSGAKRRVGCLIVDIQMPGMSGIELQALLNTERCPLPIIFITGCGDIPLAVSAMKQGFATEFRQRPRGRRACSLSRAIRVSHAQRTGDIADVGERPSEQASGI